MKALGFAAALCFLLQFGSTDANAQGYYHRGVYAGSAYGWGWFPVWSGYGVAFYPSYGYSYLPYYHYQPYYAHFSAIAYSKETNKVGISWYYNSKSKAIAAAEENCGDETCKGVVWVQGGCAAIAKGEIGANGEGTDQVSWAYHVEKFYAEAHAKRACKQSGARNCQLLAWSCSQ